MKQCMIFLTKHNLPVQKYFRARPLTKKCRPSREVDIYVRAVRVVGLPSQGAGESQTGCRYQRDRPDKVEIEPRAPKQGHAEFGIYDPCSHPSQQEIAECMEGDGQELCAHSG